MNYMKKQSKITIQFYNNRSKLLYLIKKLSIKSNCQKIYRRKANPLLKNYGVKSEIYEEN